MRTNQPKTPLRAVHYVPSSGERRLGRLDGSQTIVDAAPAPCIGFVPTPGAWHAIAIADGERHNFKDVRILHPLRPRKLLCVGLNYTDHAAEVGADTPVSPIIFSKLSSAVIGHEDSIVVPPHESRPDWEAELALVIGSELRGDVDRASALAAVGGYTGFNDVSGRDAQFGDGQWMRGKSFDTFAPMGPAIVRSDGVDWMNIGVRCTVAGTTYQDGSTKNFIFDVARVVQFCAAQFALVPGDVITTGTPSGVGLGLSDPVFLMDGDVVEVEVGDAGVLRNQVVRRG